MGIRVRRLLGISIAALLTYVSPSALADESSNCNLVSIPPGVKGEPLIPKADQLPPALREQLGAVPLVFRFPNPFEVPDTYSGCLNSWFEGNVRMIEARFSNGQIQWLRMGERSLYCEYTDNQVTREEVDDEFKAEIAAHPRVARDVGFCPPGVALAVPKWRK